MVLFQPCTIRQRIQNPSFGFAGVREVYKTLRFALKRKSQLTICFPSLSIIEGAAHGAGRGKEVIAVARSADAILIVLDAGKENGNRHREILERELETVGIRLNQRPPDVTLSKRKTGGGIKFASTVPQPHLGPEPEKLVTNILKEYRIVSADVLAREGEYPVCMPCDCSNAALQCTQRFCLLIFLQKSRWISWLMWCWETECTSLVSISTIRLIL